MPQDDATARRCVRVLLPLPVPGPYDYAVPDAIAAPDGAIVRVPLGARETVGVVLGPGGGHVAQEKLRAIIEVRNAPPLRADMLAFIAWVARYTLSREGAVLRMVLRSPEALDPPPSRTVLRLAGDPPARMTPARRRVLGIVADGRERTAGELAWEAGTGLSVPKGLVAAGTLEEVARPGRNPIRPPCPERQGPVLSVEQRAAAGELARVLDAGGFASSVLEGVTGSGKTEVYFEAIAKVLRAGRQVLVLLPEIALGAQFLLRFGRRFGAEPGIWHSDVPRGLRRHVWRGAATGEVRVAVGARSALFLPFRELGLIVVDEEHDVSYKQDDGVCYNARDMAVVRARLEGIPVILCSATPSLETLANVDRGRYRHVALSSRHGGVALPEIVPVDMRRATSGPRRWLSQTLADALTSCLDAGEQSLLFLNRRGYAPLTLCGKCGYRFGCPNCSAWLVEHRHRGRLLCHHCGAWQPQPESCQRCHDGDNLSVCGPGVERLAEEVSERFPSARLEIMASDTLSGPDAVAELVGRIERRELDILIGTQVAAKGHHFPLLTLVGVIDADLGLDGGDPRAMERTWQLLHQVAGRAGREERPGRVFLQTYDPGHPVMRALITGEREGFLEREKQYRRDSGMPPYGRLAGIVVSGADEDAVRRLARELGRRAPRGPGIETLGPAPAPLAMLRGRHRWRLLVKARRDVSLQAILRSWLEPVRLKGSLRLQVDVDPLSFL